MAFADPIDWPKLYVDLERSTIGLTDKVVFEIYETCTEIKSVILTR
jgi:hypothetical protein